MKEDNKDALEIDILNRLDFAKSKMSWDLNRTLRPDDKNYIFTLADITRLADRYPEKMAAVLEKIDALENEIIADNLTSKKQKARMEEEAGHVESIKRRQISIWIDEKGTEDQKKRHAKLLLPIAEIMDAMHEEAFSPLGDLPHFTRLTHKDIECRCEEQDDKSAVFAVGIDLTATAEEFDRMEQIQSILPDAKLTLKCYKGWCDRCAGDYNGFVEWRSIHVSVPVGAFIFCREYAV
jgi:hypothetical protein